MSYTINAGTPEERYINAYLESMPTGKHDYTAHAYISGAYWFNAGTYGTRQEAEDQGWKKIEDRIKRIEIAEVAE